MLCTKGISYKRPQTLLVTKAWRYWARVHVVFCVNTTVYTFTLYALIYWKTVSLMGYLFIHHLLACIIHTRLSYTICMVKALHHQICAVASSWYLLRFMYSSKTAACWTSNTARALTIYVDVFLMTSLWLPRAQTSLRKRITLALHLELFWGYWWYSRSSVWVLKALDETELDGCVCTACQTRPAQRRSPGPEASPVALLWLSWRLSHCALMALKRSCCYFIMPLCSQSIKRHGRIYLRVWHDYKGKSVLLLCTTQRPNRAKLGLQKVGKSRH